MAAMVPPSKAATKSTVSQDFTLGITNVIESNLQDFPRTSSEMEQTQASAKEGLDISSLMQIADWTPLPNSPLTEDSSSSTPPGQLWAQNYEPILNDQGETPARLTQSEIINTEDYPAAEQEINKHSISTSTKRSYGSYEYEAAETYDQQDSSDIVKRLKATTSSSNITSMSKTINYFDASAGSHQPSDQIPITVNAKDTSLYRTLHRVICSSFRAETQIYEDIPRPVDGSQGHLIGNLLVLDIGEYLLDFPDLAFVVYKDYKCRPNCQGRVHSRISFAQRGSQFEARHLKSTLPSTENVAITSPILRRAIEAISTCHMDTNDRYHDFAEYSTCSRPYRFFFHHLSQLKELLDCPDTGAHAQVKSFLDYLYLTEGLQFDEASQLFAQGLVSVKYLPLLFCPNQLVISQENGVNIALVLAEWPPIKVSTLSCWTWGPPTAKIFERRFRDSQVGRVTQDKVSIAGLETYPLRFASEEVKALVQKRGEAFWNLRIAKVVEYSGFDFKSERTHIDTRFIVDYSTYRKLHPDAYVFQLGSSKSLNFDNRLNGLPLDEDPNEENIMLLPANIHGFDLKEKKWFNLFVDNVKEVQWNVEAFKLLVLPKPTKDLIQALVEIRASPTALKRGENEIMKRQDIISGKGRGLIILLHGGPGTGKTLTAESVAEIAKMPLYRVTCGDIGTNAEAVEKYLQNILYLGKVWNCILLLDEADIFLEQRSLSDLERNSLVSVFLRVLEYYEGILILTTNRVGTFDEAFRSRIQISLHYEKLSPEFRRRIWQNFFNMLRTDNENADLEELEDHLVQLASEDMNGREIRNALTTARQLASHKREMLTWRHLDLAIKTAGNFNKYLKDVHGGEAEDLARENRDR